MAITYTWDVSTVDTYPTHSGESDVIYNVHWRLTGTDDTNNDADGNAQTETIIGTQTLDVSDLSNFVEWADITNAKVQTWTLAALGTDKVAELKASVSASIAEKVTPTTVTKVIS